MEAAPIYQHLRELRNRFLAVALSLLAASAAGWVLREQIVELLLRPFPQTLYYTTPAGGLSFLIKVSILFGLLVSIPILYYQLWAFIAPALPSLQRRFIRSVSFFSTVLFLAGISFSYFLLLPAALTFFNQFQEELSLAPLISGDAYFAFVTSYLLWFGVLFQIPVVFLILNKFGILERRHILQSFPYAGCASFLLAAFITPTPDPINQTMVALPILALFALSWVFISDKKKQNVFSNKTR